MYQLVQIILDLCIVLSKIIHKEASNEMANQHYNQNYNREQIKTVLMKIRECVEAGRFQISMNKNRQENIDFINEYNIYPKKEKKS